MIKPTTYSKPQHCNHQLKSMKFKLSSPQPESHQATRKWQRRFQNGSAKEASSRDQEMANARRSGRSKEAKVPKKSRPIPSIHNHHQVSTITAQSIKCNKRPRTEQLSRDGEQYACRTRLWKQEAGLTTRNRNQGCRQRSWEAGLARRNERPD